MDTNNLFSLLLILSLIFISAQSVCVPRNFRSNNSLSQHQDSSNAPRMQPVSSPQAQPMSTNSLSSTLEMDSPSPLPIKESPSSSMPRFPILGMLKEKLVDKVSTNPAIKKLCDSTDYSSLCVSSITPLLSGHSMDTADSVAMLELVIKAASDRTKLAIAEAEKIINTKSTPANVVAMMKDCKDNYEDALDNYQSALDAIPSRDIGTVNTMLSAALTDYTTCDDGFESMTSPVAEVDRLLTKLASNTLAIASLV